MEYSLIHEKVYNYILQNISLDCIDCNMDIFDEGLVSSLFAIELMVFLEKNFEIKIIMEDLDITNFKSVNNIIQFVQIKKHLIKMG